MAITEKATKGAILVLDDPITKKTKYARLDDILVYIGQVNDKGNVIGGEPIKLGSLLNSLVQSNKDKDKEILDLQLKVNKLEGRVQTIATSSSDLTDKVVKINDNVKVIKNYLGIEDK